LKQIIFDLTIRKETDDAYEYQSKLAKLRGKIDEFDAKLLDVIGKRMKVTEDIGALKKEKNVAVLQNKRWNEILEKMVNEGSQKGLSEEFIIQLFKAIHQESISHQEKIING
jgi:chorismate mutase